MQPLLDWTIDYVTTSEARWLEGCSRDEIESRVRFAYESALSFGISEQMPSLRLVVLLLELGPAFNRAPTVRAILAGPGPQRRRLDALTADPAVLGALRLDPPATRWSGFHPQHDLPTDD